MRVSRRGLLAGAAVGGGLVVAWALWPRSFPDPLVTAEGETAFGAWLKIAEDGVVTVAVPQLEMGQGVSTILPQIVATELGADWRQIAVEHAPVSGAYANIPLAAKWAPLWMPDIPGVSEPDDGIVATRFAQQTRLTATAAGTTLSAYEQPAREAAATARALLVQAAADRWGVAPELCDTRAGFVVHETNQLRFADLAAEAALLDPPDPPPLRVLAGGRNSATRRGRGTIRFPAARSAFQGGRDPSLRRRYPPARHAVRRHPPRAGQPVGQRCAV